MLKPNLARSRISLFFKNAHFLLFSDHFFLSDNDTFEDRNMLTIGLIRVSSPIGCRGYKIQGGGPPNLGESEICHSRGVPPISL